MGDRMWIGFMSRDRFVVLLMLLLAASYVPASTVEKQPYRSPFDLAYSPDGGKLAISDRTAGRLYILDAEAATVAREIVLRGSSMGIAWQADGRIAVSE